MPAGRKIDGQFVITLSPVKSVIRWELVGEPDMLVHLSVRHMMDALPFGEAETTLNVKQQQTVREK